MNQSGVLALLAALLIPAAAQGAALNPRVFAVTVVDDTTGRGVPLVELRTVNEVTYFTDSAGVAAIDEPGLDGKEVFFHVRSTGYSYPADAFGYHGLRLRLQPGGQATIKIHRLNVAERLYRITGQGIYRDSVLAGLPTPIQHPLLDGDVLGQDTVMMAPYHDRLFWLWGDTNRPSYPLGNFSTTCATSALPGPGGLDPSRGIELDYFVDADGFARPMAPLPGPGPVWLDSLLTLPEGGQEHLFAAYAKVRADMSASERGIMRFEDADRRFKKVNAFAPDAPLYPRGQPLRLSDQGVKYLYFSNPYPLIRVRAEAGAFCDTAQYEAFTCLKPGVHLTGKTVDPTQLDRDAAGHPRYAWKRDTSVLGPGEQERFLHAGALKPGEGLLQLQDVETGKPISAHNGSVHWNPYLKRWVMIAVQAGGDASYLGEVWFSQARSPLGPWIYARKVATHEHYTFYNPVHHPELDQEGGRLIYFEGTYASTFSGNDNRTPRYDYNQLMYRLDLADPRLNLPAAVDPAAQSQAVAALSGARFCAMDRPGPGLAPVTWQAGALRVGKPGSTDAAALFYALPTDSANPPATTAPLYEWTDTAAGSRRYSVDELQAPGFQRSPTPLCRVWKNPCGVDLPAVTP